ncbi:MAG: preprotein translocase subunit SecE [Actinobacteria bacterium]|nr:preprotein translocase subunit SecE [Actinomycetota bacterium]
MQKEGQLESDGSVAQTRPTPPSPKATRNRTTPSDFAKEVKTEMSRVAWPTKQEVINYSIIVLIALTLIVALIFGLDYTFSKAMLWMFKP